MWKISCFYFLCSFFFFFFNISIPKISCQLLQEGPDVRLAIQEALSMMVGAYVNLQGALLNLMEALVAAYIAKVSGRRQFGLTFT